MDELKNSRDLFITEFFNMFNPSISKVINEGLFYTINFTTKDADSGTLTIANQNGIFGANQIHQKIKIRITSRRTKLSYPKIIEFYWEGGLRDNQTPTIATSSFSLVPIISLHNIIEGFYLYEGNNYTGVNFGYYDQSPLEHASFIYDGDWHIQLPYYHQSAGTYRISGMDISIYLKNLGIFPQQQSTKEFDSAEMIKDASLFFLNPKDYPIQNEPVSRRRT